VGGDGDDCGDGGGWGWGWGGGEVLGNSPSSCHCFYGVSHYTTNASYVYYFMGRPRNAAEPNPLSRQTKEGHAHPRGARFPKHQLSV
jgi:hypothetical protein